MDTYLDFDVPTCFTRQPQAFVAFVGLDVAENLAHKNIWDVFTANRHPDRVNIGFSSFPLEFTLPVLKPKRTSYEWYVPKGILKANWIHKHSQLIPSAIVLFYELDWDDKRWSDKKLECASRIHTIRTAIGDRNIKITIVLLQKSVQFINTGNEESLSTERASELCSTCDINPKLLLLLPTHSEHLQGYIIRLENAFYELAQTYYAMEIRNIKMHKEYLNKSVHHYLFVRHQFKIAYFNEMKHDFNAAYKHYTTANSTLLELRITDANLNEVKTVVALIIYKLCKLGFTLNQPREAISQFNTHIERFRMKIGPSELIFEHYAWLSKQFYIFGNLFEQATCQGLPAGQTRHPGFYYEQAAQYARQRKSFAKDLDMEVTQYPENDPLVDWNKVDFYGQRPWRLTNRSEVLDNTCEQVALTALQYREKFLVNHGAIIIAYLGNAISQFKTYRSPRKRRYLAVQMAEEYYSCGEYGKALTLFTRMLWEYRNDKWWELTVDLTRKALDCAYLTASFQEYVERCVEAAYLFPDEEKLRILQNIQCLIKKLNPQPEPQLLPNEIASANDLWSALLTSTSSKCINVDMPSVMSFILCKVGFGETNCDKVDLDIWLKNEFPSTVEFSQLSVSVMTQTKSTELIVIKETDLNVNLLRLESKAMRRIPFKFTPAPIDVGHEIRLKYVALTLGSKLADERLINLRFTGICTEMDVLEGKELSTIQSSKEYISFFNIESKLVSQIMSKVSKVKLSIDHKPPNLICEWYPFNVTLYNGEPSIVKDCSLCITVASIPPSTVNVGIPSREVSTNKICGELFESIDGPSYQSCCSLAIPDIPSSGQFKKTVFFKTNTVDIKTITFRFSYRVLTAIDEEIPCIQEENLLLDCVNVFEITASFLSTKCEHVSKIYANEPLLMRMQVDCVSAWPLYIENTSFKLMDDFVIWDKNTSKSYLKGRTLRRKEIGAEVISFRMKTKSDESGHPLGLFSILWRRLDDDSQSTVCTEVQLPQIKVDELPLFVDADISSPGWVRTPVTLRLTFQNNSEQLMSFDISIEHNETDVFMFSGSKQGSFNITPGSEHVVRYNLFPLQAGYVPLPYINLTVHSDLITQNDLNDFIKRTLPTSLFVMPQKKHEYSINQSPSIDTSTISDVP